jgi:hypothetical protein
MRIVERIVYTIFVALMETLLFAVMAALRLTLGGNAARL